MKKWPILAVLLVLLGVLFAYLHRQKEVPVPRVVQTPPPVIQSVQPGPQPRQVLETPPSPPALPNLEESDRYTLDALARLIGDGSLMRLFVTGRLIHNIVATIDNLPRRDSTMKVMPVKPLPGDFIAEKSADGIFISPRNAARYAPYVKIAEKVDAEKLVRFYIQLYPLFQKAYEEIGYPGKYFNDRLMVALDNLIAAPDVTPPVKLVQPKVLYQYADPDLESRSIGQRIMMRMGQRNESIVREKLKQIREDLLHHMHGEGKMAAEPAP